jgi:hypothetical protein
MAKRFWQNADNEGGFFISIDGTFVDEPGSA